MSEFNIHNSKIDQLNNSGDNYKQTSKEGNNAISQQGNVVQSEGEGNKIDVNKPSSLWASLWGWLKGRWTGKPTS